MGQLGCGIAGIAATVWLVTLSVFDIRVRRLPNVLTLPGAAVVVAAAAVSGVGLAASAGALAMFGTYAVVHLAAPTSLGAGDVKLAIGVGALTGAFGLHAWLLCTFGASLLTALWGIGQKMRGAPGAVPHGVSMCVAAWAAVLLTAGGLPHG